MRARIGYEIMKKAGLTGWRLFMRYSEDIKTDI
jgi:hypothetical protein